MNLKNETGAAMAASRSAYEAKVGVEAVLRSGGKNPQLKGVVHEILYRDALTMKPGNLANGARGTLSKSVTAVRDDVLLKQGGAVVGRAQLKDAVHTADRVARQAAHGKYAGTKLMGTKETVMAYEKAVHSMAKRGTAVTQKMTSTGISSTDTGRIAAQTLGDGLKMASLGKAALTSGGAGAVISGGIEAVSSGKGNGGRWIGCGRRNGCGECDSYRCGRSTRRNRGSSVGSWCHSGGGRGGCGQRH